MTLPMQINAVIFDIDGTLADSFQHAYDVTGQILAKHGRSDNVTPDEYRGASKYCTSERLARNLAGKLKLDPEVDSPEKFRWLMSMQL